MSDKVRDTHLKEFRIAWAEFAATCWDTVAPEATYQAWLAHFLMKRLGVLSVVREVDFGARHLGPRVAEGLQRHHLMLDVVVLRKPIVYLPRRSALTDPSLPDGSPNPRSGLARLQDFSVVCELKVSSTRFEGHDYSEMVKDFLKLTAILNAAEKIYPKHQLPAACIGILGNHRTRRFDLRHLMRRLSEHTVREDLEIAYADKNTSLSARVAEIPALLS